MLCHPPQAIRRLWGNKDYSVEVEEMLEEYAALQGVHYHTIMELIRNQTVRWQLLTVIVASLSLQLCGINAVSDTTSINLVHNLNQMEIFNTHVILA